MPLDLLLGPIANVVRDVRPVADAIDLAAIDEEQLFVCAPVFRENRVRMLFLRIRKQCASANLCVSVARLTR